MIDTKTVTIARLMEIAPPGTLDPTPGIYDSTLYAMGGVVSLAVLANAAMRPVDLKHCEVLDGACSAVDPSLASGYRSSPVVDVAKKVGRRDSDSRE